MPLFPAYQEWQSESANSIGALLGLKSDYEGLFARSATRLRVVLMHYWHGRQVNQVGGGSI